ncbi:unnamed protein product [Closterium sp. Naga37s-1]|nr:unnamed protein product [Closterium sp. Naga37s-1]
MAGPSSSSPGAAALPSFPPLLSLPLSSPPLPSPPIPSRSAQLLPDFARETVEAALFVGRGENTYKLQIPPPPKPHFPRSSPSHPRHQDQLPPDFAPETAEAALFVGRAMLLLQEVGRRSESELSGRGAGSSRQRKHKGDVKRILDSVLALRQKGRTKHAWDEQRVHEVVEAARKRAAHRLWQLVVRQSDIFGHLHAVHYFLLGGGGAFMQSLREVLAQPDSVWQSLREVLAQPDVRARVANDKLQLAVEKVGKSGIFPISHAFLHAHRSPTCQASACIGEEATLKYFRTFSFK